MTILDTREIFRRAYLELLKEPGADLMTDYIANGLAKDAPDGREFVQALFGIADAFEQAQREKRMGLR
jgi:beta-phosphoglucomutase-like phosphatase (HAD superfamily)